MRHVQHECRREVRARRVTTDDNIAWIHGDVVRGRAPVQVQCGMGRLGQVQVRCERVVHRGRERVLGRYAVVDREDPRPGADIACQAAQKVAVARGGQENMPAYSS